mgnify:FL=1|jgi:hypothetical protein
MALWGDTDVDADIPTYLTTAENAKCYFIDTTEAGVTANRAKGLKTTGWNLYEEYGTGRKRVENLVAMTRTAVQAGDAGTTGVTATEDAVVADS